MTIKTIIIVVTLVTINSCTSKTPPTATRKNLTGAIEQGQFKNDYLSLMVNDEWTELQGNDTTQFLIIHKVRENFKPNIILLALDKKLYKEEYGFQTVEQYMSSLTDNFKAKPDYELISSMEKITIASNIFHRSGFLLHKGDKKYRQYYYGTDMNEYFLGIVTTDDNADLEPDVEKIVQSIRFR